MLKRYPGNLDLLLNRPRAMENHIDTEYPEYRYMMHLIPILLDAHQVVETGLGAGYSSTIHLEGLSTLPNPETRRMDTFDHRNAQDRDFLDRPYQESIDIIRSYNLKAQWTPHLGIDGIDAGRQWSGPKIDYLYLDSDHGYRQVKGEIDAFYDKMARRCVIMTDDVWGENAPHEAINSKNHGQYPYDTYYAFKDFYEAHPGEFLFFSYSYPQGKSLLVRY